MDSAEPVIPDERLWITYSRKWALPLSALTSPILHILLIGLVIALSLWVRHEDDPLDIDTVVLAEAPGGGANGIDDGMRLGLPQGKDVGEPVVNRPQTTIPEVTNATVPVSHQPPPDDKPVDVDVNGSLHEKFTNLPPLQSLKPLLQGLPTGSPRATGEGRRGAGKGTGTGPGEGDGDGAAGRMSQKQKRQLRWTLLFNIKSPRDYLDQLGLMKAIVGVQYPDKSIKLIRDPSRRPAVVEAAERVPDRIFWMDDSPDSVRALAAELGITDSPWRMIAFFPASVEEELLQKEHAFGLVFGRETEDQILETIFQVTDHYGDISISVLRQTGKK